MNVTCALVILVWHETSCLGTSCKRFREDARISVSIGHKMNNSSSYRVHNTSSASFYGRNGNPGKKASTAASRIRQRSSEEIASFVSDDPEVNDDFENYGEYSERMYSFDEVDMDGRSTLSNIQPLSGSSRFNSSLSRSMANSSTPTPLSAVSCSHTPLRTISPINTSNLSRHPNSFRPTTANQISSTPVRSRPVQRMQRSSNDQVCKNWAISDMRLYEFIHLRGC